MREIAELIGYMAAFFATSLGMTYLLVVARRRMSLQLPEPEGTLVRLRASDGVYRATVLQGKDGVWTISAPLRRDNYVPLMVGAPLTVEWPTPSGVVLFRSKVVGRDSVDHTYHIEPPSGVRPQERRESKRTSDFLIDRFSFDGAPAELLDLGKRGCRLRCRNAYLPGTRVRLDFPWRNGPAYAAVLESLHSRFDGASGFEVRVVFEEPLEGLPNR